MYAAARFSDPLTHDDALVPCGIIGPPLTGQCPKPPVNIEGKPAAQVNCTVVCTGAISARLIHILLSLPLPIVKGSATVNIHGMPAALWLPAVDTGGCGVLLGDSEQVATRTVFIGGCTLKLPQRVGSDRTPLLLLVSIGLGALCASTVRRSCEGP